MSGPPPFVCARCKQVWTDDVPGCRWKCWLSRREDLLLLGVVVVAVLALLACP